MNFKIRYAPRPLVEIFSKGSFRYSVAEGFSGEAQRLMINERLTKVRFRVGAERVDGSTTARSVINESNK